MEAASAGSVRGLGRTSRRDPWWLSPVLVGLGLGAFGVYALVVALQGDGYLYTGEGAHYLSPFYSPDLPALLGLDPPFSPAFLVLWVPLGLRATCYYYRKAYYRSFWLSPPGCAVAEPHSKYTGETRFPLILQNVHRYFFWILLLFNAILTIDAVLAFRNPQGEWGHMGLGTLVLMTNAALLWLYSLSCHSCRHAVGGRLNHFSRHPIRYWMWTQVSKLNARHLVWAWASLFSVALADLYVFLVASGTISDPMFF